MKTLRTAVPALLLPLLATVLPAQERVLRIEPLRDGVHMIASSQLGDPNVLVVTGSDGVLLVDGMGGGAVGELLRLVGTVTGVPVTQVVLTHWHPDHTLGNAELRGRGAVLLAHPNAAARMRSGNVIAFFGVELGPYPEDALPDRLVEEPSVLRVGEHAVRLIPLPPAHTDGDVLVHLPGANLLHMGDLQLGSLYPFVELSSGGDPDGLVAALDLALTLADDETVIVTGHGPRASRADLVAYRDLLATVWERVKAGVAAGSSLEEVIASGPAAEYDAAWSTGLIPTDGFVSVLYQAAAKASMVPL
jgi:cyclase